MATRSCSCLENLMDRGAWWAMVRGNTKSWTWLRRQHAHACVVVQQKPCNTVGQLYSNYKNKVY